MNAGSAFNPKFNGNENDLKEFMLLANSPIRSEKREIALHAWENYKLGRQRHAVSSLMSELNGKRGIWGKGDYISSLTARVIDLRGIHTNNICIGYADFRGVNFDEAVFDTDESRGWIAMKGSKFQNASFRNCKMTSARLMEADLSFTDFTGADLTNADLRGADLTGANLFNANLQGSNLQHAILVNCNLQGANISGSRIYGISAWDIILDENTELRKDLIVTPAHKPDVRVDSIEVAQFVYLLLNNSKITEVINTVFQKGVLILGRFTSERKQVLDSIRDKLRNNGYLPILFDFTKPDNPGLLETVMTLTGLVRFIIADITSATMVREELRSVVEKFPSKPIQPLLLNSEKEYVTFPEIKLDFKSILEPFKYNSIKDILSDFDKIIQPAEDWLEGRRNEKAGLKKTTAELEAEIAALRRELEKRPIE